MSWVRTLLFPAVFFAFASCQKENPNDPGGGANNSSQVTVTTFSGTPQTGGFEDGPANAAKFKNPRQLIIDTRPNPNFPNGALFVADQGTYGLAIRAVDAVTGAVSTYVDKGVLETIGDIILDTRVDEGGALLITDTRMNVVYQVRPDASGRGVLTPIAGGNGSGDRDGSLEEAQLSGPTGLAIDKAGKIYVFSSYFKTLKKIDVEANTMTKFAGRPSPLSELQEPADGVGLDARFKSGASDLSISADGRTIYLTDWHGHSMHTVGVADARVSTAIPYRARGYEAGSFSEVALYYPGLVAASGNNTLFYTAIGLSGGTQRGTSVFMADFKKQQVYRVLTGNKGYKDGNGKEAQFEGIEGIAVGADGRTLYISDYSNHVIRKVEMQ